MAGALTIQMLLLFLGVALSKGGVQATLRADEIGIKLISDANYCMDPEAERGIRTGATPLQALRTPDSSIAGCKLQM
jgi:hypothetical protein